MNVSETFIRRPIATTLLTIGLALSGIVAYFLLPVADNHVQVLNRYELKRILNHMLQNAAVAQGLQNQRTAIRCDRVLAGGKDAGF